MYTYHTQGWEKFAIGHFLPLTSWRLKCVAVIACDLIVLITSAFIFYWQREDKLRWQVFAAGDTPWIQHPVQWLSEVIFDYTDKRSDSKFLLWIISLSIFIMILIAITPYVLTAMSITFRLGGLTRFMAGCFLPALCFVFPLTKIFEKNNRIDLRRRSQLANLMTDVSSHIWIIKS